MPPTTDPHALASRIDDCMLADQRRLRDRLRSLQQSARQERRFAERRGRGPGRDDPRASQRDDPRGGPVRSAPDQGGPLERLIADIERSAERRARRAAALPRPDYPAELPVVARRAEIAAAIRDHQVVVVCGETGSGKTTQIPKICLELGRGAGGMIGHTQPRRIAARSVAARLAEELRTPLGRGVGFKVRFTDRVSPETHVKVMTDGALLAETQGDRRLEQYDTIIIDEAHERSLNIDFLLGYLHQLLPRRPDLKVIVTSATIDPQRFARHFASARGPAPIVMVSGRTYPVEVRHRPLPVDDPAERDREDVERAILDALDEVAREGPGDVLIFLSGEREIRETAELLHKHHVPGARHAGDVEIVPLYARLSAEEQQRVFQPHKGRRIVLATNVAETSLTVPGIVYVIDPGEARISRYSPRTRIQRLPIEPISRASADQRKGRCGRVAPGVCVRLYSEQDYLSRPEFTDPEILRTNLASVILQMKALRLGDVERFPFVERPDGRAVKDGLETLEEIGALDERQTLTPLGAELARLPLDPRIGRMVLAGSQEGSLEEALVIASALSVQDPRERPLDQQDAADASHEQWKDERSDFMALLNLWGWWAEQKRRQSSSKLRRLCRERFVSHIRLREWDDVHQQIRTVVTELGHHPNREPADYGAVHRALLAGLLGNVGEHAESGEYNGTRGGRFSIHPGSGLFRKNPRWVMAAELVRTTRLYARTCAKIEPAWVEKVGAHLVKRAYTEPRWDRERGEIRAQETVTLYGLPLVRGRDVHYGPIDPRASREAFIHHGLVEGELRTGGAFMAHNAQLMAEVERLESKARKRDLLASAAARHAFYDARVPANVYSGAVFEAWRREAEARSPRLLYMGVGDVLAGDAAEVTSERFPDETSVGDARVPLRYIYEPGDAADGVTMVVPIEALHQVDEDRVGWLTPGMMREKALALLKSLPKEKRRAFVPAPDVIERCLPRLRFGEGSFEAQLAAELHRDSGERVEPADFRRDALPDHLRMRFEVRDEKGETLASGRDLQEIRSRLGARASSAFATVMGKRFAREGVVAWDLGDLPDRIDTPRGSVTLAAYPALVDAGENAAVRVFDSPDAAAYEHRRGLRRLFALQVRREVKFLIDNLAELQQLRLLYAPLGSPADLLRELTDIIVDRAFVADKPEVRTKQAFDRRLEEGWSSLHPAGLDASRLALAALRANQDLARRLASPASAAWGVVAQDVRAQAGALVYKGFLSLTPYARLQHTPRYLAAASLRLEKLNSGGAARDARAREELAPLLQAFWERVQAHRASGVFDPALEEFRWMLEELRVSLFAQELGTAQPVSVKRLWKFWEGVRP